MVEKNANNKMATFPLSCMFCTCERVVEVVVEMEEVVVMVGGGGSGGMPWEVGGLGDLKNCRRCRKSKVYVI